MDFLRRILARVIILKVFALDSLEVQDTDGQALADHRDTHGKHTKQNVMSYYHHPRSGANNRLLDVRLNA